MSSMPSLVQLVKPPPHVSGSVTGHLLNILSHASALYLPRPWSARNVNQHFPCSHFLGASYPEPGKMVTRSRTTSRTLTGHSRNKLLTDCRNLPPTKADGSMSPAHTWNFIVVARSLYSPGELSYKYLHNCYLWISDNRIVEDQQTCNASHRSAGIKSRSFMFPILRINNENLNITSS